MFVALNLSSFFVVSFYLLWPQCFMRKWRGEKKYELFIYFFCFGGFCANQSIMLLTFNVEKCALFLFNFVFFFFVLFCLSDENFGALVHILITMLLFFEFPNCIMNLSRCNVLLS